ncbi:Fur family transcriptional regulator [Flavobacterium sp. RNTU_13]|uniref:Fur family transcriptional regulator n=1 Tax=Flavobacterium sp. RNTU_13 TaxID=3375145 RepID=UPI003987E40C
MKRRNTPTKQAILDLLKHEGSALSQDNIIARLNGEIDRVTVYRVLNRFCDEGLVHKFQADNGKYYFALCAGCNGEQHSHNHFHFRCLRCEKVQCLPQQIIVALPEGYRLNDCNGWVNGYCAGCN